MVPVATTSNGEIPSANPEFANGVPVQGEAVSYSRGTPEWKILNKRLGSPALRIRRADAHQPTTRDVFKKALEFYGKVVPEVDHGSPSPYSKLGEGEIRILRLYHSKHPDDPLKADLFKRKLDDVKGDYEALSYCWGTEGPTHEIQIRDLNAASAVVSDAVPKRTSLKSSPAKAWREAIRRNLFDALKRLRGRYDDVPDGAEEKQGQLAMMARIYNCAANNAFELAREVMNYKKFDKMINDPVMRMDWFSRRWIIQEIALSRNATIHRGSHSLHWDDFADAVSLLVENIELMRLGNRDEVFDDTLGNICQKSDDEEDRGEVTSRLLDIETLVSTLLNFQATYPHAPEFKEDWQELHLPQLKKDEMDELEEKKERWEEDLKVGEPRRKNVERRMIIASDQGREEEARRLRREIQRSDEDYFKALERAFRDLSTSLDHAEFGYSMDKNPITLLPNYTFSPRDLFIAFVTRSIHQTGSLDIICRHWAPELNRVDDGADQMPSWISSRSRASFGLPGTARGRQNGENLVAYLPHDQRRSHRRATATIADSILDVPAATSLPTISPDVETVVHPHSSGPVISSPTLTRVEGAGGGLKGDEPNVRTATLGESSVEVALGNMSSNRGSVRRLWGRFGAFLGSEGRHTNGVPPIATTPASILEGQHEGDIGNSSQELKQGDAVREDETLGPPTNVPVPEKTTQKTPVAANFPSATSWTPSPHRLSGILVAKGFVLGVVRSQSDVMRGGVIPGAWVSKLGWTKGEENQVPDTLWRLLVADRMSQGARPPLWYKRACLHGLVDGRVSDNAGNIHPVTPKDREISKLTSMYFKRVEAVVWNRRIFELAYEAKVDDGASASPSAGHVNGAATVGPVVGAETVPKSLVLHGLGPEECEVGNIVCVLYGCSVPVVLKKAAQQRVKNKVLYELVGEAYVHGIMDGEFMIERWTELEEDICLG
ncbi:hypothetical protein QBC34DRAFT_488900 [Podospora aff. communis PSN243]|uniref:Heterokaryon incompatibility domain-containing protein n=1 Tax=Podospora aff. communis PSN243 TaxID=3040156 RepID=A0AAV9FX97_9PEZI|nr:hypothetical protein QBC34DRAFT_488900 [Podospora aff. communis PSN243]